jgi:signal transduction histidine kinase/CheY-like chemotaxis protein
MNGKWKNILQAASILLLLAVCLLTGGSQSPFRFAYYPLIILLGLRVGYTLLLQAGFTFSILFVLLVIVDRPASRQLVDLLAEAFSFFLVTMATAFAIRNLAAERERAENATTTFHSLSEDLKHRTMNLQTTLEALSEAHKRLQESDREKTKFLANVSHELRTPLSSIRSYSEILLSYDDIDTETRRDFIRTINSESERMTTLVNENLDLIRIEAGKVELNISQIDPAELIAGSVKVVAPMAEEKKLALEIDISPDLPAIRGDRQQLTQVLINLFNNAIKFTAEGTISAGAKPKGDYAEFFVSDTGEGIFPEEQGVIFDEFFRISDNVPDRPRGSGLGLSIAKKIVEYHGGKIWVDSTPGKGSTFYFTVPVATEEGGSGAMEGSQRMPVTQGGYGPILVLYESAAIRQSLRKRLEKVGYQTLGADIPERGVEIAAAVRPGLIIADFAERSGNFLELEKWAKENGIEVLLATLYLSPASGELSLAAHGYLEKPFDKYQIASLLERFQKNRGRFFIISPEQEEARQLQVLLGAEGYSATIYLEEEAAVHASAKGVPHGIIIGSFPPGRREEIVTSLKGVPQFRSSPFFLVQGGGVGRYVKTVTFEAQDRNSGGEVLYPLIMAIEKAYARKWQQDTAGGGEAYGKGLAGGYQE